VSDQPTAEDRFRTAEARFFAASGAMGTSRMLRLGDTWTHLVELGGGRPVLILHAAGLMGAAWMPLMTRLEDGFRLLAPDLPGFGLTDKTTYRGLSLRVRAITFVEQLLDALGLDSVSLVGSGMGGYWSLLFALAKPDRVERLVLLGAPAGSARRPPLRRRLAALPVLNRILDATVWRPNRERLRQRLGSTMVAHPERLSEPLLDVVHAGAVLPGARRSWRSLAEAAGSTWQPSRLTYALHDELRRLRVPALLVWGKRDPEPPELGEELCKLMPAARLEVLPDAGEMVWLDDPERTGELVRGFLTTGAQRVSVHPPA
jgi:pimeloyl-ACP methyl ester carboxylesterase